MKKSPSRSMSTILGLVATAALSVPTVVQAAWWTQHPGYLHAMSDLRTASWLIQHRAPNDPAQSAEEGRAMNAIFTAYGDLQQASIVDDKNITDQLPADFVWADHRGRLHQAEALLQKAHDEINREEDNPAANGLRNRALHHIEDAGRLTDAAIRDGNF